MSFPALQELTENTRSGLVVLYCYYHRSAEGLTNRRPPSASFDENITDQRQHNSRSTSGTPLPSTPSSNPARTRCAQDASLCPGGGLSESTCGTDAEQTVRSGICSRAAAGQKPHGRMIRKPICVWNKGGVPPLPSFPVTFMQMKGHAPSFVFQKVIRMPTSDMYT